MKRRLWLVGALVLALALVGGILFVDHLDKPPEVNVTQAEKDAVWRDYIHGVTNPNDQTGPRPDPRKLCDNMQRIAEGKQVRPSGGELWPSAEVAREYVDALC